MKLLCLIFNLFFFFHQMSSSSATSSERTRQMLRARMKSNIWLVQDRGPLTVTTTTIPSLPCINPQPVCIGGEGEECIQSRHAHCTIETCPQKRVLHELLIHLNRLNLSSDRYAWAFNWFISNCKRSCNINVHIHILRIQRAKSENRRNFHETFNPCGVRANVNIMFKKNHHSIEVLFANLEQKCL